MAFDFKWSKVIRFSATKYVLTRLHCTGPAVFAPGTGESASRHQDANMCLASECPIIVCPTEVCPAAAAAPAANGMVDGQWGSGCHVFRLG